MPNDRWGFQIERICLDGLDIDASQKLGMVIVQPKYELVPDGAVPFQISAQYREAQNELIKKAFQIREFENQERNSPVPFILFPEAAIPVRDPDGLDCVRRCMEEAQGDVIFISGLEGMTPNDVDQVVEKFTPGIDSAKPLFADGTFVNLCLIVVKMADGELSWHFQAKLRPSQWEQGRNMAHGRRVLYFVAPHVAFLSQICFDHIAAQGHEHLNTVLCIRIKESTKPHAAALDFVFVPQYNPDAQHASMRQNTSLLLNHQDRLLMNAMTSIVVVNKAARLQESPVFGRSGFHYRADRWQVPIKDIGPKVYELYDSDDVTSAVFRKRTQAIHVASLLPAADNVHDPGNLRQPLENSRSYLIGIDCEPAECSCLPGSQCGVGKYVECDCLPCKLREALMKDLPTTDLKRRWTGLGEDQSTLLASHYDELRVLLFRLNCDRASDLLDLLFFHREHRKGNPDTWSDAKEVDAVRELIASMSVLRVRGRIEFETVVRQTAVIEDTIAIAVLDGENTSNCRTLATEYLTHYKSYSVDTRLLPLLIVAIRSTGRVDPIISVFQPDHTEVKSRGPFKGNSPYERTRERLFLCRDDLFQEARQAPALDEYLNQEMGTILA